MGDIKQAILHVVEANIKHKAKVRDCICGGRIIVVCSLIVCLIVSVCPDIAEVQSSDRL